MQTNSFRGIVLQKYRSIAAFSKAVEWNYRKAYRIVNGEQDPNIDDMQDMVRALEIKTKDDFISIFFEPLSTLWTGENTLE